MKVLIGKVIAAHAAEWKANLMQSTVSLPRLVDMKWRLDIKSGSSEISRMSAPTVVMQMQIQQNNQQLGILPTRDNITFELDKETLATMLKGFHKIRDQLATIS